MRRLLALGAAFGAALSLGACATVTRGSSEDVEILSDPAGATARSSLGATCVTPCKMTVARDTAFSLVIEKEGFRAQEQPVKTQVSGLGLTAGVAGNLALGGPLGAPVAAGVDAYTGAAYEHYPNPVKVTLRPDPDWKPGRAAPRMLEEPGT